MLTFSTIANAIKFKNTMKHESKFRIALGDDGLVWIVNNLKAKILLEKGYTVFSREEMKMRLK